MSAGRGYTAKMSERHRRYRPELAAEDLSQDVRYLQDKLATKKDMIAALLAKVDRLEAVLRSGGTWADYQRGELLRAQQRAYAREHR